MKGYYFLDQTEFVADLFRGFSGQGLYMILVHYVAITHLCGGILIMLGLLTRWSSLVQLPTLIGAVLINFVGLMHVGNLIQAVVALALCVFFVWYGSGKHSVDYNLKLHA
jgi:uncharacterized membrane protein YphA (DoxX/SURF4 family)